MHRLRLPFDRICFTKSINTLVFLFFVSLLLFAKGYSYVPILLAAIGLIYMGTQSIKSLRQSLVQERILLLVFLCYFLWGIFSTLYHGDGIRELDNPSRILLLLPLIVLFKAFPIDFRTLLYAIPLGASIAGGIAMYQRWYLHIIPFPGVLSIQAGDIAVTLGSLSFAITLYWLIRQQYYWAMFSALGTMLGYVASFLSTARGGWISLPIVISVILICYRQYISKKWLYGIISGAMLFFIAMVALPQSGIQQRYLEAQTDIQRYLSNGEKNSSIGARFDMWENALRGAAQKPLLGWGTQGYKTLKQTQVEQNMMSENTLIFHDAHNQYLDTLVKKGGIGLISLLAIFIVPLYVFLAPHRSPSLEKQSIRLFGLITILSTMIFCLTQSFLAHHSGIIFYVFLIALFYTMHSTLKENTSSNDLQKVVFSHPLVK